MTSSSVYLSKFALARSTYLALHESAMSLLPPSEPLKRTPEPIEAIITVAEVAKMLRVSSTVVRRELSKLRNFGWISDEGRARYRLGTRIGAVVYLIADVQAEEATGLPRLVSVTLKLDPTETERPVPSVEAPRGAARRWEP